MDQRTKSFFQASGAAAGAVTASVGVGVREMIGTRW